MSRSRPSDEILLVFAKVPRAGRVKTRLAADLGAAAAADVYRRMGRRVVERVRPGRYRTVVCYDPPGGRTEMAAWLGPGLDLWPQEGGDLGARMAAAFGRALARAARACVIGTDAPDVHAGRVEEALDALDHADVVLGPAADGGYWLLGLDRPRPGLFAGVPWSTPAVLDETRRRVREAGLRAVELETLTDVDTADDLPADLRPPGGDPAGRPTPGPDPDGPDPGPGCSPE